MINIDYKIQINQIGTYENFLSSYFLSKCCAGYWGREGIKGLQRNLQTTVPTHSTRQAHLWKSGKLLWDQLPALIGYEFCSEGIHELQ